MSDSAKQDTVDSTKRRRLLAALGGSASVGLAGCSALFGDGDDEVDPGDDDDAVDPGDDDDGDDDTVDPGDDDDGDDDEGEPEQLTNADRAQAAWETVEANPEPEAEDVRNEAYVEIEEAIRDDMILLPLFHNLNERFWFDWVDVEPTGSFGGHHQIHNETTVEDDDTLNMINSTFDELDPIMSTDTASAVVIQQMYETLTQYPSGVAELENHLIEEFELADDDVTWTFTLREGVEFHDGTEMTADDVIYSWRRLAESPSSERANFILGTGGFLGLEHEADEDEGTGPMGAVPDSLALEAVDDHTLEMTLQNPNPGALDIISYGGFAVVPEGIVGDIEGYDGDIEHDEFRTEMANGTGPFEFDFFEIGEEVQVTAADNYWGSGPELDAIHWEIVEDDEAIWTYGAEEQNADIIAVPDAYYDANLVDIEETDDLGRDIGTYGPIPNDEVVNYVSNAEISTFYFGFNARHVPREIRQAVAYATDHDELVNEIFLGRGAPAFSFTPPGIWPTGADGYEEYLEEWPYSPNETDLESAQQVLEEGGYTPDDPFDLTLTTYDDIAFQEAAELTRDKLAGTGVEFDIDEAEFGTLIARGEDGDLEMYSLGWIWSWGDVAYGHFGFEPKNTNTDLIPTEATGYYLDWHVELDEYAD